MPRSHRSGADGVVRPASLRFLELTTPARQLLLSCRATPPLRGGEFSLSLPIRHLMHDLTADHGHVGGDVPDRRFRYSERIGAQNRQVSEPARCVLPYRCSNSYAM